MENSEITKMSFQIFIQNETSDPLPDKSSYFPDFKNSKASGIKDKRQKTKKQKLKLSRGKID